MFLASAPSARLCSALLVCAWLAGCGATALKAPVEVRAAPPRAGAASVPLMAASAPATAASAAPAQVKLPAGAENAGRPGYYTVKPGDNLMRIGAEHSQNWRDVARWNGIDNANLIEVGQVLRVLPPTVDASTVTSRGVAPARVEARPLDGAASAGAATAAPAAPAVAVAGGAARESEDEPNWSWPSGGAVAAGFEDGRNKGLIITGKAGDPVLAAADGRVVYSGSGLRGYGNLVIVKHNNTYLTAYAHNQALLVKDDQVVRRGQKIAEMGASDADRVQLLFEIRRAGKPIDPARLLPSR